MIQAGDGNWSQHLIYWVGPIIGAATAAFFSKDVLLAGVRQGEAPSDCIDPEHPQEVPGRVAETDFPA